MSEAKTVVLAQADIDKLPEYSTSIPTGTTIGKKWKRAEYAMKDGWMEFTGRWWMGQYVDIGKSDEVGIEWSRITLEGVVPDCACSKDDPHTKDNLPPETGSHWLATLLNGVPYPIYVDVATVPRMEAPDARD